MRYALYFTPDPKTSLWQALCSWLGRDPISGLTCPHPSFREIHPDRLHEITRKPRRYGPHATLKAPFHLHDDTSKEDLFQALADFCQQQRSFVIPPLTLSKINDFYCLVPIAESPELNDLAAACVQEFDSFRAPATPTELARRKAAILTDRELQYLKLWGYPHVFNRYRFHITLTSRLTHREEDNQVLNLLERTFVDVLGEEILFNSISLFVEPGPGKKMILLKRYPLGVSLFNGKKEEVILYGRAGEES